MNVDGLMKELKMADRKSHRELDRSHLNNTVPSRAGLSQNYSDEANNELSPSPSPFANMYLTIFLLAD